MDKRGKIGVFDSGIGGVTVLGELIKELPEENYIYYSDSKNNPYGDKTDEEVQILCDKIVQYLIKKKCKAIVIACNTASAKAAQFLRNKYPEVPFIAIEPAYKMVFDNAYNEVTLVMATKGTIQSEKFHLLLDKYNNKKTFLLPCVGLADKIEQGNKKEIKKLLEELLIPYKDKVENVVLGCTHYPLIQEEIQEILGQVQFFNGAPSLAKQLKRILQEKDLFNRGEGNVVFEDSQKLEEKQKRFFELVEMRVRGKS